MFGSSFRFSAYQLWRVQATFLIKTLDVGASANFGALSSGLSVEQVFAESPSSLAFIFNVQSLLTVVPALIRLESFLSLAHSSRRILPGLEVKFEVS